MYSPEEVRRYLRSTRYRLLAWAIFTVAAVGLWYEYEWLLYLGGILTFIAIFPLLPALRETQIDPRDKRHRILVSVVFAALIALLIIGILLIIEERRHLVLR